MDDWALVRPWLYAIARYKVVDAFRARGGKVEVPIEDFDEILAAEAGQALNMTEGAVRVALHRAFKTLASLRERHLG